MEKHVLVHLGKGMLWSSLKDSTDSHLHDDMIKKTDLLMVYLGRGNFALLQQRIYPLQVVETSPDTKSIVLGTFVPLSPDEEKILDSIILSGLGIGINHEQSIAAKTATATSTVSIPKNISEYSKNNNSAILSGDKSTTCIKTEPTSACDTSGQKLTAEKTDVSGLKINTSSAMCTTW